MAAGMEVVTPPGSPSDESDDLLAELRLALWQIPLDGPPDEWYQAVAQSAVAMTLIVKPIFPDVATFCRSSSDQVLSTLRRLGRHDAADAAAAAFVDMCASEGGCAVIAVCGAAYSMGVLGRSSYVRLAANTTDDKLNSMFKGKPYLPVLLAAARFYRDLVADSASAAALALTTITRPPATPPAAHPPPDATSDVLPT